MPKILLSVATTDFQYILHFVIVYGIATPSGSLFKSDFMYVDPEPDLDLDF